MYRKNYSQIEEIVNLYVPGFESEYRPGQDFLFEHASRVSWELFKLSDLLATIVTVLSCLYVK